MQQGLYIWHFDILTSWQIYYSVVDFILVYFILVYFNFPFKPSLKEVKISFCNFDWEEKNNRLYAGDARKN